MHAGRLEQLCEQPGHPAGIRLAIHHPVQPIHQAHQLPVLVVDFRHTQKMGVGKHQPVQRLAIR